MIDKPSLEHLCMWPAVSQFYHGCFECRSLKQRLVNHLSTYKLLTYKFKYKVLGYGSYGDLSNLVPFGALCMKDHVATYTSVYTPVTYTY